MALDVTWCADAARLLHLPPVVFRSWAADSSVSGERRCRSASLLPAQRRASLRHVHAHDGGEDDGAARCAAHRKSSLTLPILSAASHRQGYIGLYSFAFFDWRSRPAGANARARRRPLRSASQSGHSPGRPRPSSNRHRLKFTLKALRFIEGRVSPPFSGGDP